MLNQEIEAAPPKRVSARTLGALYQSAARLHAEGRGSRAICYHLRLRGLSEATAQQITRDVQQGRVKGTWQFDGSRELFIGGTSLSIGLLMAMPVITTSSSAHATTLLTVLATCAFGVAELAVGWWRARQR